MLLTVLLAVVCFFVGAAATLLVLSYPFRALVFQFIEGIAWIFETLFASAGFEIQLTWFPRFIMRGQTVLSVVLVLAALALLKVNWLAVLIGIAFVAVPGLLGYALFSRIFGVESRRESDD